MRKWLVICFLLISYLGYSQPASDTQLAAEYFRNKDYEKSLLYFEKLYNKAGNSQSHSNYYYTYYLACLNNLERFKEAEKLAKKQARKYPQNQSYALDLGEVYEKQGLTDKAKSQYEKAIKNVGKGSNDILKLGNAFKYKSKLDYALQVFEYGAKTSNNYPFEKNIAEIYGLQGNQEQMVNAYLDVLKEEKFAGHQYSIQRNLETAIDFSNKKDPLAEYLRIELLKRIQKNSSVEAYNEMLIWYFLQREEYNSALIQTKALDKRRKSEGEEVFILSQMCVKNKAFSTAIKGYKYVYENFPESYYGRTSKSNMLDALFQKVTSTSYTNDDLQDLKTQFESALSSTDLGKNSSTVPLMQQLAHIEAFYLKNPKQAETLLNEALNMPGIPKRIKALCKLDLADIQVLTGKVWSASLNYMQVEKMYKEDTYGHTAKFRNARIYYYTGQFDWAQGQLDALKASTSKLIANDAMQLSLLITDNTGLDQDTSKLAMKMFAQADLMAFQLKHNEALATLDSIHNMFFGHALADEILYKKYEIFVTKRNYSEAVTYLEEIKKNHSEDILADDAIFNLGDIYQYQLGDKEKAKEYYKTLIFDFPGSIFTAEARKRYRALGGKESEGIKINKENGPKILNSDSINFPDKPDLEEIKQ